MSNIKMIVILLHGTGGSDKDYYWFADTKKYLESLGYEVWWPLLPHFEKLNLNDTLNYVLDEMPPLDHESIIIGHSSACPLILSLLEKLDVSIKQAVLVSGFYQLIGDDGYSELMLQGSYDRQNIHNKASDIILINSENDPWGCDDRQARPVAERLGAAFVFASGQGHMGSSTFNQQYTDFPILKQLIVRNI